MCVCPRVCAYTHIKRMRFAHTFPALCRPLTAWQCAAGGNIYTQKVMQKKMSQPLMLQNAVYVWRRNEPT